MVATYIFNGAIIDTVVYDEVELVEVADLGAVGQSRLTVRDDDGTINITGLKSFIATENDCSDERTLRGFVGQRTFQRGTAEHANARFIEVMVDDLNDLLGHRVIRGSDAKRPAETVSQRVSWLLNNELAGLVADNGRVASSSRPMDKVDHRNSYPGDVLAECALAAGGFNYYVYQDPTTGAASLAFRDDNDSTAQSSIIKLTNVHADLAASSNTFLITDEMTLARSPAQIYSRVILPFARGTVMEERLATASNYARRDGVAPNSNVKKATNASREAKDFLWQHRVEEDVVECAVAQMPAAAVNLIHAGDRVQAKFGHVTTEGYGSFTWFRVLRRQLKPLLRDVAPAIYEMRLTLSPQEAPEPTCSYPSTPAGYYYPLGGDNPGIDIARPSDGIVFYCRSGLQFPNFPWVGFIGRWHFPTWGGPVSPDYFASGFGNELRFVIIGNGTLAINTVTYQAQPQPYTVLTNHVQANGSNLLVDSQTGTAGDTTTIVISTASAPNCTHVVSLRADRRLNGTYIGMGWSSILWTPS